MNFDCVVVTRKSLRTKFGGYNPQKYLDMYNNADPGGSPKDKLNSLRRIIYQEKKIEERTNQEKNPFLNSETSLEVNKNLQNNHIAGTNEYKQRQRSAKEKGQYGPSYVEISIEEIQKLIDKHHGTGIIKKRSDGKQPSSEVITDNDKIIGVVVDNRNGNSAKTSVFKIHYGKNGTHIVPDYPSKKRGNNGTG